MMKQKTEFLPILFIVLSAVISLVVLGAVAPREGDDSGDRRNDPKFAPSQADEPGGRGFLGGPPGGPGGPPGGFGPGMFIAPRIFEEADKNDDGKLTSDEAGAAAASLIVEADTEKKGSIDAKTLGRAINKRIGPPPGFGPEEPSDDFGPGTFMAPAILEIADTNKDGKLTPDEASKAVVRFVGEADVKKQGFLDSAQLIEAINRRTGPPPGFGPGGPGGMPGRSVKLTAKFDKNGDGVLDREERRAARDSIKADRAKNANGPDGRRGPEGRRGGGGPGSGPPGGFVPPPGFGGDEPEVKAGPHIDPADVKIYSDKTLYDPLTLRTIFLDFDEKDWEDELADFHGTDVEVAATMTVDGKKYTGVGARFRGMSSYMMVRAGHKRSLNLSIDHQNKQQRLYGYKTLNLLNSHEDPTFLHTVLYFEVARRYMAAPRANFVRVVVNGESWGLYVNAQQFDKTMLAENLKDSAGTRWKVRGNPGADGGLRYLGDKIDDYKNRFEIKSDDDEKAWKALITLCETLNRTPVEKLEKALEPILDIDGVLRFLALDVALINSDGYWVRSSDYCLFRDSKGVFHVIPHDANETFQPAMMMGPPPGFGPRGRDSGGRGDRGDSRKKSADRPRGGIEKKAGAAPRQGGGVDLDPLVGLDDDRKPLRSRLLAVPSLKRRYLEYVRAIAQDDLDWSKLGPVVAAYRSLIESEVKADTRKLTSFDAFQRTTADSTPPEAAPRGRNAMSIREFAEKRRTFLLNDPTIKNLVQ